MENQRAEDLTVGKVVKAFSRTSGTDIDSAVSCAAKPDEEAGVLDEDDKSLEI